MRSPRKPAFYGWWVLLACTVVGFWAGGIFFSITIFVTPIVDEFKWTYLAVSAAASLRSVEMGIMAPAAGFLADRFSPGKLIFMGGMVGGIGLVMLSQTNSLFLYYTSFIVFSIGFTMLGQSVTTTVIANWFRHRVGLATGIMVGGYGAGGIILPLLAWMNTSLGWRMTILFMAVMSWLIVLPVSRFVRQKREQDGFTIDGGPRPAAAPASAPSPPPAAAGGATVHGALRTRNFWLIAVTFSLQFALLQAITLHIAPYSNSVGFSDAQAALIAMMIPLSSVVGRLLFGWMADRFGAKPILAWVTALQLAGLSFLLLGQSGWMIALFVAFYGPAFGGSIVTRASAVREYFGLRAFGSIQGLVIGFMTIGGIIGPAFAGWVFDTTGSYQFAWLVLALATAAALVAVLPLRHTSARSRAGSPN